MHVAKYMLKEHCHFKTQENYNCQWPPKKCHPKEQGPSFKPAFLFRSRQHFQRSHETHPSWGSGLVVVVEPLLNFWRRTRQLLLLRNPGVSMQQLRNSYQLTWILPLSWTTCKVSSYFDHTQAMHSTCNDCKWLYKMCETLHDVAPLGDGTSLKISDWNLKHIETIHSSDNTLVQLAKKKSSFTGVCLNVP